MTIITKFFALFFLALSTSVGILAAPTAEMEIAKTINEENATSEILAAQLAKTEVTEATDKDTASVGISDAPIAETGVTEAADKKEATSEILATQSAETEVTEATDKDAASVGISDAPIAETGVTETVDKKEGPVVIEVHRLSKKPNDAWEELKETVELRDVENEYPEQPPNDKVRIVFISDTHHKIPDDFKVPYGDILIHAGDFTLDGEYHEILTFRKWIEKQPHPYKIVIAGNHDRSFDPMAVPISGVHDHILLPDNVIYLQDNFVVLFGIKIYGSPWQAPHDCRAAFAAKRGPELLEKWNKIPDDVDVLVTHTPPLGIFDLCDSGVRAGCVDLFTSVRNRIKPSYHVFGHIHESYGMCTDGRTLFMNAAIVNREYKVARKGFVVDVPSTGFDRTALKDPVAYPRSLVQFP